MVVIQNSTAGVTFAVTVHPRAKKNAITGELGDALKLGLTAPPVDGKANEACVKFFAKLLKVPRSSVTIAAGETSRNKVIRVTGLSADEVRRRLGGLSLWSTRARKDSQTRHRGAAMLHAYDSTGALAHTLQQIKLLHTAIWGVMAASILALPWLGWCGKFRWVFGLTLLIIGECLVLAVNGGHCPLTDMAARYSDDRACNFDIYLPIWLACNNKRIFGSLFVAGELVVLWQWARRPGL